jgi:hypothetical protein
VVLAILQNCIGAIDGTHVPVKIFSSKQITYIDRKGTHTHNIMAVCDFNVFHLCLD